MSHLLRGRRRVAFALLGVLATLWTAAGCAGASGDDEGGGSGSAKVTVALSNFANSTGLSWNAAAATMPVFDQVYDTLVRLDDDGQVQPSLAESWEVSKDELTYTFKIRDGVPFHKDYGNVTAQDVLFNFKQWLDPKHTGSIAQVVQPLVKEVSAPDDSTFVVTLNAPNWGFLEQLDNAAWILSKKYVDEVGDKKASEEPVGTGPFEWTSSKPGSEITFTKVDGHFLDDDANYDTLVLRLIPDLTTQLSALDAGEVDAIQVTGDSLVAAEAAGHKLIEVDDAQQTWVVLPGLSAPDTPGYDPELPWVGDSADPASAENAKKVRHALAMAIDKEQIIESVFSGAGSLDSFGYYVRAGFPGFSENWKPLDYDPEAAKALLADAGYADGFTIDLTDTGQGPDTSAVTQAIGQYWEAIGVKVELAKSDMGTVIGEVMARKDDYALVYATPAAIWPSSVTGLASTGAFRFVVNDEATDKEVAAIAAEADPDARAPMVEKLMDRLVDEQYALQLASKGATFAVSDRIADWGLQRGNGAPSNYQNIELAD